MGAFIPKVAECGRPRLPHALRSGRLSQLERRLLIGCRGVVGRTASGVVPSLISSDRVGWRTLSCAADQKQTGRSDLCAERSFPKKGNLLRCPRQADWRAAFVNPKDYPAHDNWHACALEPTGHLLIRHRAEQFVLLSDPASEFGCWIRNAKLPPFVCDGAVRTPRDPSNFRVQVFAQQSDFPTLPTAERSIRPLRRRTPESAWRPSRRAVSR